MNAVKRDPVEVGAYVLSHEAYRLSSFILFGALILICVILTVAFTDIPENTEIVRAFGYNNVCVYSTSPRNGNPVNGNHLDQSLSFSQKNGNSESLTWVLVALPACPTSPLRLRDSAEPRPNLELASGNCES